MQYLGFEKVNNLLYLACIRKKRDSLDIRHLSVIDLNDENPDIKPLDICKKINAKNNKILISGLAFSEVLLKEGFIKTRSEKNARKALSFHETQVTTLKNSNELLIETLLQKTQDGFAAFFNTTTKTALKSCLNDLKNIHIEPDFMTCKARALTRFVSIVDPTIRSCLILHICEDESACILMENNLPKKVFVFPVGKKKLQHVFEQESPKKEIFELSEKEFPELYKVLGYFQEQFNKAIQSFLTLPDRKLPLLITGNDTQFQDLPQFLLSTNEFLEKLIPVSSSDQDIKKFAIPIGFALDALANDKLSLQFCKNEFTPLKTYRKTARKFLLLAFLAICAPLAVFFSVEKFLQTRTFHMKMTLSSLNNAELLHPLKGPVSQQLSFWERKLKAESRPFPYFVLAPPASEIISWLSQQEMFLVNKNSKIRKLTYNLESFPRLEQTHDPYLAKIELEAYCPDSSLVRKFYDQLRDNKSPVSAEKEIEWTQLKDGLKTTFYLKNHSPTDLYEKKP